MDLVEVLDAIVNRLIGREGAIVLLCIVLYFLWRLYRESQKDLKASDARVDALTTAVQELTAEVRARRR